MELAALSLTEAQADTLQSVLARLIPADRYGPGAAEAGVIHFIDSELSGALRARRGDYIAGLAALDELSVSMTGRPFTRLDPASQDEVLRRAETRSGTTGSTGRDGTTGHAGSPDPPLGSPGPDLAAWFDMVLGDCIDGYLSDPAYGGNVDAAGWRVIGYPGPSLVWREDEQQLDVTVPPRGSTVLTLHRRMPE